jgi:hypothetical protein
MEPGSCTIGVGEGGIDRPAGRPWQESRLIHHGDILLRMGMAWHGACRNTGRGKAVVAHIQRAQRNCSSSGSSTVAAVTCLRLQAVNIPLHRVPLGLARRQEVSDVALFRVSTGSDTSHDSGGASGSGLTRSVTPRCRSNSSRANLRVSARVLGSAMRRVLRRMAR